MKYSLNMKLFAIIALLIFSLASLILILNSTLLETFYLRKKQNNIIQFYENISNSYTSGDISQENLRSQFEKLETNRSIDFVIKKPDGSNVYLTSKDYSADYNDREKVMWTNRPFFMKEGPDEELTDDIPYIVRRYHDNFLNSDFLVLIGKLNDGSYIYLRSPLEFVKESIEISNTFLLNVTAILLVLSSILTYFISRTFTKPISDLNEMTKKMSNLDFSKKYEVRTNDEIGMLGRSINSLSESLETKIKQLNEANMELEKDIEETSKISEMRSQFVSDVSHELKTPIALIQGYAEGLVDNVVKDEESRNYYLNVILDEANKMSELTKGLLDLTNLEYGNNELNIQEFDVTSLISSITKKNEILLSDKDIELQFDDNIHYDVFGDMFRIEQVITNYLNNAIKNIGGDRKIKILIEEKEHNIIRVNVENTGKNINEEDLSRIWIRFYKLDNARTRNEAGSGIGLSLVRAIMTQHGNNYGVNNTKVGVNFWFELNKVNRD